VLNDYDRAISDVDESRRLDPTNPEGYMARAVIETRRQRYDAALQAYDEFGKRSPKHIVNALLGRALTLEAAGRPAEALLAYENVLKVAPTNSEAMGARERLRRAGGR
jgi:tetratricopeptide (TPR) repeat protein